MPKTDPYGVILMVCRACRKPFQVEYLVACKSEPDCPSCGKAAFPVATSHAPIPRDRWPKLTARRMLGPSDDQEEGI